MALHTASYLGRTDLVEQLLKHGADPSVSGDDSLTALHWVAARNHTPALARLLVKSGAEVDATNKDGMTALHFAADKQVSWPLFVLIYGISRV